MKPSMSKKDTAKIQLNYNIIHIWKSMLIKVIVPEPIVSDLNVYLDDLMEKKGRKSHAHTLVGQINRNSQSQQLLMDHKHPMVENFSEMCLTMAYEYFKKFSGMHSETFKKKGDRIPQIDELWSVHSYEGDYNPLHTHGTKSMMGVSLTTWTKIPPQVESKPKSADLFNASGNNDGYLNFVFGTGDIRDQERLVFSNQVTAKPTVGELYIFPSHTQHSVNPFFGDGERRTVACNVNMWPKEQMGEKQ